eukprot:6466136-Heterocapsa_arctica.AAC.1
MANHLVGPHERATEANLAYIKANGLQNFRVDDRPGSIDAAGTSYQAVEGDSCAAAVELRSKIIAETEVDDSP